MLTLQYPRIRVTRLVSLDMIAAGELIIADFVLKHLLVVVALALRQPVEVLAVVASLELLPGTLPHSEQLLRLATAPVGPGVELEAAGVRCATPLTWPRSLTTLAHLTTTFCHHNDIRKE